MTVARAATIAAAAQVEAAAAAQAATHAVGVATRKAKRADPSPAAVAPAAVATQGVVLGAQATAACMDEAAVAGTLLVVSATKAVSAAQAETRKAVAVHAAAGDVEAAEVAT